VTPGVGSSPFQALGWSAGLPPITWPTQGGLVAIYQPTRFPSILGTALFLVDIQECVGIEKQLHFHRLRHTCASELLEEGLTVAEIRDWLGHTSLAATDKYLRKISPHQLIEKGRQRQW
jgi:integrase